MFGNIIQWSIYACFLIPLVKLIYSLLELTWFCCFVKRTPSLLPSNFKQKFISKHNEELTIRYLSNSENEKKQTILCLQESFSEDPLANYFVQDYPLKDQVMQTEFKIYLESQFSEKFVLVNKDNQIASSVIWYDANNRKYFNNILKEWKFFLTYSYYNIKQFGFFISQFISLKGIIKAISELRKAKVKADYVVSFFEQQKKILMKDYKKDGFFYIYSIGTIAKCRGKGLLIQFSAYKRYGVAILQPILNLADLHKKYVYLESSNQLNVNFYKRLGFEAKSELKIKMKEKEEILTIMVRKPQLKQE